MTVHDLIDELKEYPTEAQVLFAVEHMNCTTVDKVYTLKGLVHDDEEMPCVVLTDTDNPVTDTIWEHTILYDHNNEEDSDEKN